MLRARQRLDELAAAVRGEHPEMYDEHGHLCAPPPGNATEDADDSVRYLARLHTAQRVKRSSQSTREPYVKYGT